MGDRAQLKITDGEHSMYLYTHWNGSELPTIVRMGVDYGKDAGRTVETDPSYAVGIIIKTFIKACGGVDERLNVGFGFSTGENDGDDRVYEFNYKTGKHGWVDF